MCVGGANLGGDWKLNQALELSVYFWICIVVTPSGLQGTIYDGLYSKEGCLHAGYSCMTYPVLLWLYLAPIFSIFKPIKASISQQTKILSQTETF